MVVSSSAAGGFSDGARSPNTPKGGEDVPYDLQAAVEEWIARLPDEDWSALCARVRPPDEPATEGEASR